jgi:hypothetical protein
MMQPYSIPLPIDDEIEAVAKELVGMRDLSRRRRKIIRVLIGHRPEGEERHATPFA